MGVSEQEKEKKKISALEEGKIPSEAEKEKVQVSEPAIAVTIFLPLGRPKKKPEPVQGRPKKIRIHKAMKQLQDWIP